MLYGFVQALIGFHTIYIGCPAGRIDLIRV